MERTLSVEERIKRAEERYYKTKEIKQEIKSDSRKNLQSDKIKNKILRKSVINIFICLIIYGCCYQITSNQYVFSEDFTNKTKEILNKDINLFEIYSTLKNQIDSFINSNDLKKIDGNTEVNSNIENTETNNIENTETDNNVNIENTGADNNSNIENTQIDNNIQNNNENIGGGIEIIENADNLAVENDISVQQNNLTEQEELSQMELDAKYVKENISIIKPVSGKISSKYGLRNPTTATVPKNHTGTDIATSIGTKIVSATDGKVILNSSEGDYGKHLKIQIGEIILVYAHCNKLYVNEGDEVTQGQEIAEVGNTGNTTGPHLHFEIRYQNRYIDPEMILDLS